MRKGWFKHTDHVPHPKNGNNMSQTLRFLYVLTIILDGVRFSFIGNVLSPTKTALPQGAIILRGTIRSRRFESFKFPACASSQAYAAASTKPYKPRQRDQ